MSAFSVPEKIKAEIREAINQYFLFPSLVI